jgi:addiction module HigA family antidote
METIYANDVPSFRAYHPGELLKEELECRNILQKNFAEKFGLSYTALNEVLNGKRSISVEFALQMEAALGVNADILVRMQTDYNLQTARKNSKLSEKLAEIRRIAAVL